VYINYWAFYRIVSLYQKNCHVLVFSVLNVFHCWSLLLYDLVAPERAVCLFFVWWFIRLIPRCIQVRAGFQQPLSFPFVGLQFVLQVEQFGVEVKVLPSLNSLNFLSETRRICWQVCLASSYRRWFRWCKCSSPRTEARRLPPVNTVVCPHGFLKHGPVWLDPGGAIGPVAGHVLREGLQCGRSLALEAVNHRPDFVLWHSEEGQRQHHSYEVEGSSIVPGSNCRIPCYIESWLEEGWLLGTQCVV